MAVWIIYNIDQVPWNINITITWANSLTTDNEEEDIESFDASVWGEIDHTPKQDMLIIIGDWYIKIGSKTKSKDLV